MSPRKAPAQDGAVEVVRRQDLETYLDELRRVVCRVDALADAAVDAVVGAYGEVHEHLVDERVHQLATATAEAALHALREVDRVRLAVAEDVPTVQIRNGREIWDGE